MLARECVLDSTQMTSLMRPLSLHASALSDTEYEVYTSSLNDIADEPTSDDDVVHDDAHYEQMSVGVREVRAWLRGRYSHIPASTIDNILKYFSPNLGQGDSLTGGQFFAALRLVVHADNGKEVDRSLAFAQADPASKSSKSGPPPPPPLRRHHNRANKPVSLSPTVNQLSPASSSTTVNNSFPTSSTPDANLSPMPQAPPQHPMLRVDPIQTTLHSSHNPFSKTNSTQKSDDPSSNKSPPLPPRKPPPPIPSQSTRHAAPPIPAKRATSPTRQATGAGALFPSHGASHLLGNSAPPLLVSKPVSHVTSTLIKQSLHASKVAQSLKKAEEQLEKERIMQVLKSSSGGSATTRNRSASPIKAVYCNAVTTVSPSSSSRSGGSDDRDRMVPPLPRRRDQPQSNRPSRFTHSPPQSIASYEQIALSGLGLRREPSTSSHIDALNDVSPSPSSHGDMNRGRTRAHSKARSVSSFPHDLDSNSGSVTASTTSSPSRMSAGLPAIPPPTHPDLRERNEKDKGIRRYSSLSVHSGSGKSSLNRLNTLSQPVQNMILHKGQIPSSGPMDTRSFDSVYGSLVSPVDTGNDSPSTPATSAPSLYATPSSEIAHLPPVQTNMPSQLSTTSLDSLTPTTSNPSPTTRVFRSKSLLQPPTPPPIPPPLRRQRPESARVVTTSTNGNGGSTLFQELVNKFEENMEGEGSKKLLRHLSLSTPGFSSGNSTSSRTFSTAHNDDQEDSKSSTTRRSSMSAPSAPGGSTYTLSHSQHRTPSRDSSLVEEEPLSLAALQRTFASLQPKLDKARYKAEAGISRRGFIQGDGFGGNGTRGGEDGGEREGLVHHPWSRLEQSGSESSGDEAECLREVNGSLERDERTWTGAAKIW